MLFMSMFLSSILISFIGAGTILGSSLVLQLDISHPRNVDQISLIFGKSSVGFVTNVFHTRPDSSNNTHPPTLGQFRTPIDESLALLQQKILAYRNMIEFRKNITDNFLQSSISQRGIHASVIRIGRNGKILEIGESHPQFTALKNILYKEAYERQWNCLLCAEYKRKDNIIQRIVKRKNYKSIVKNFSLRVLRCNPLGTENKKTIECVDEEFGIFEI